MHIIVRSFRRQIFLILLRIPRLLRDRNISLCLGIGDLHLIGQKILGEQPGCKNHLRIRLVENADRRTLRDHLRISRVVLRDRTDSRLKFDRLIRRDIRKRGIHAHPGRTGSGVDRKDALTRVQEISRVAGNLERRERTGLRMSGDLLEERTRRVVKDLDRPVLLRVRRVQLLQHLDHHIVGRLVNERDHRLLPVHGIISVRVLCGRSFGDFPDKVPGKHVRKRIAQLFNVRFVHIAGFCRPHVGKRVNMFAKPALLQEFRNDLLFCRSVIQKFTASQPVLRVRDQVIHRNNDVRARHIGRDIVRISDADIRRRVGGNIGNDIIIDLTVVRIQTHIDRHIRVQGFKIFDRLLIDPGLCLVGIIFRPESELDRFRGIESLRNQELVGSPGTMAARKEQCSRTGSRGKAGCDSLSKCL